MIHSLASYFVASPVIVAIVAKSIKYNKRFFGLSVFISIVQAGLIILSRNGIHNIWLINLSGPLMAIGFFYVFNQILKIPKHTFIAIILPYFLITSFFNFHIGIATFNKPTYLMEMLGVIIISITTLIKLLSIEGLNSLHKTPMFWTASGALFYYSIAIFIFGALDIGLTNNNQALQNFYLAIHPYIIIITYSLYCLSFLRVSKKIA